MVSLFSTYYSFLKTKRYSLFSAMVLLTGILSVMAFNIKLKEDITKIIPFEDMVKFATGLPSILAITIVFLILFFHFRKIRFIPLIFLPGVFGTLSAVAVAWLLKDEISIIALGLNSVLLVITVDYAIHTVSHILKSKDVGKAISDLSFPMVLSSLTTASAFACLLFLDSPVLNDLGLLASVSLLAAMLFSLAVLPHIVDLFGIKESGFNDQRGVVGFIASKEFEKSKFLVIGVILITAVMYFVSDDVKFLEADFQKLVIFSIITVFLLLFVLSGRIELAIAAMIPLIFSWIWILGFMSILEVKFNITNIIVVTFIFGLGISYVAFIMRAKMQEYIYDDKSMAISYKRSILISCFTTIVLVGALSAATHTTFRPRSLITVIGMISTLINSFVLAPAIFDWLLIKQKKKKAPPHTFIVFIFTFISYTSYVIFSLVISSLGFGIFTTVPFKSAEKKRKILYHFLIRITARIVILFSPQVSLRIINRHNVDLSKPSVIIANHQSFLDILMVLSLKTKIVMVTKSWVSSNPVFGKLVQFADFFTITEGFEKMAPKLKKCIDDGYSIVVFPEGTRGDGKKLKRFHKGAFFLAEKLKVDIVPIVIHGSGHSIKRGEFSVRSSMLTYFVLPEVKYGSNEFGETYQEVCKGTSTMFKKEFKKVSEELGDVDFFRDRLIKNYIYKGPDIEWYVRVKTHLEKNYRFFDEIIPKEAVISDLGCGMGMMVYMLSLTAQGRKFIAVDYDKQKIEVAKNCFLNSDRTKFVHADIINYEPQESDVFVLNDVLHYLPSEKHASIIEKCAAKLNVGGMIVIRDGDTQLTENHKKTEMTEKFSTNLGFNKTSNRLSFLSGEMIEKISETYGFEVKVVKTQLHTSNRIFILKKT